MPIRLPKALPAYEFLLNAGVPVFSEDSKFPIDVRPVRIALLNLMPLKIKTETQISRLLGLSPEYVDLTLVRTGSYSSSNTPESHMKAFYKDWSEIRSQRFDGFIATGAPVETLDFPDVVYWDEFRDILDWTQTHVGRSLHICWSAQGALSHFCGIDKHVLPQKRFGVFPHFSPHPESSYLDGLPESVMVPVSRWSEVSRDLVAKQSGLTVLLDSIQSGLCLIEDAGRNSLYMFNHMEYDTDSLGDEYMRDLRNDIAINIPDNYFVGDDPKRSAVNSWRQGAVSFFSNWLNEIGRARLDCGEP